MRVRDFALGLSAASVKPYLLDAYLGVYGKSMLDGDRGQSDLLLALVVFALLLVGESLCISVSVCLCWFRND